LSQSDTLSMHTDISMDIHEKSVDMDMDIDMDVNFYIHGKPDFCFWIRQVKTQKGTRPTAKMSGHGDYGIQQTC